MRVFAGSTLAGIGIALLLALPSSASAQTSWTLVVMPTYQGSVQDYRSDYLQTDYTGWGLVVGVDRPGRWWSPHLWVERYEITSSCLPFQTTGHAICRDRGWEVTVGPALTLIDRDPVIGVVLPQAGLDLRSARGFTGGVGLHLGVRLGAFQPQAFSRVQIRNHATYLTVGAGLRFAIQVDRRDPWR